MYQTNLLIAGWDEKAGPSLFWLDYLATMHAMNVAGTGYGALPASRALRPRVPGLARWDCGRCRDARGARLSLQAAGHRLHRLVRKSEVPLTLLSKAF